MEVAIARLLQKKKKSYRVVVVVVVVVMMYRFRVLRVLLRAIMADKETYRDVVLALVAALPDADVGVVIPLPLFQRSSP